MHRKLSTIEFGTVSLRRVTPNRRDGFTITEVVVASGLLIVAIVPILKGLTVAHLNTTLIERKTRSLLLAQNKLDEIKARSIYGYSGTFAESDSSVDGSYLCNVSDSGSGSDIRMITVSIGYDVNGDSMLANDEVEVALTTLVARRWSG
ncbi:MAG: hypothetical protein JW720_09480 [Sedimentisphaerales bacterium]|nr:hypothetical protein [Sedimentisphaerales bacterium]